MSKVSPLFSATTGAGGHAAYEQKENRTGRTSGGRKGGREGDSKGNGASGSDLSERERSGVGGRNCAGGVSGSNLIHTEGDISSQTRLGKMIVLKGEDGGREVTALVPSVA